MKDRFRFVLFVLGCVAGLALAVVQYGQTLGLLAE
jgi:hypothetical protein